MSETQDALPAEGMPEPKIPHKITFTGARATSLANVFEMDSHHKFEVHGTVVHRGPKRDAKGNLFTVVQIEVEAITPMSYVEPKSVRPIDGGAGDEGEEA
jgi:hypothetical protein